MLVKIENDEITQFPYSLGMLRTDNPKISIPSYCTDAQFAELNVMSVSIEDKPDFDNNLQKILQKEHPEKKSAKWVLGWNIVDLNDHEKKEKKKGQQKLQKRRGVEINGVMCSATRADQDGLTAVSVGVIMARSSSTTFPDTLFNFVNGTELLITDANFDGYFATWSVFRQSFFKPEAV